MFETILIPNRGAAAQPPRAAAEGRLGGVAAETPHV
jgi:hypothetical protein